MNAEINKKPDCLYHYTSLDSLALILKNKTIRFNPLNKMDDMEEEELGDLVLAARYIFVSSWTEITSESIPFWSMYTGDMGGVRIKMPLKPFCKYSCEENYLGVTGRGDIYIPPEKLFGKDYAINPIDADFFLTKLYYTDEQDKLQPKILIKQINEINILTGEIGKYKSKAWSFQEEWRYRLMCLPLSLQIYYEQSGYALSLMMARIETGFNLPFSYIDLKLEEACLKNLEIMTGPKMSLGDKVLLDELVKAYCPSAKVINSKLKIR